MIPILRDEDWELETERLRLSPISAADAELLFELLKEPALYSFTGGAPPSSVNELRQRIRLWEKRRSPTGEEAWLNWTLRLRPDGRVVGYVQSSVKANQAQLAWVIGLPFQGHGYATEASIKVANWLVERFKIGELRANIHPKHAASQGIARRLGLRPISEITTEGEEVWLSRFTSSSGRAGTKP